MSADKLGVTTDQLYMFCFRLAREFCLEGNHGDVTDILQEVRQLQLCMLFQWSQTVLSTQIQCVLQDVGSHVATPRDAATKNKLGQCLHQLYYSVTLLGCLLTLNCHFLHNFVLLVQYSPTRMEPV